MRVLAKALLTSSYIGITVSLLGAGAQAQTVRNVPSIALKNGESTELGDLYWVVNCKSLLKSAPEAEILDGPPGVTVTVKEGMVLPRAQKCANRVQGGTLLIAAKEIEDHSVSEFTVRITYRSRDGERKLTSVYNLALFP